MKLSAILSAAAVTVCAAVAQSGQGGARQVTLTDATSDQPKCAYSDAVSFSAECKDEKVQCKLTMAKPFLEGMFTCVELNIDCDDKPKTGIVGDELRVRAAVGSRFQATKDAPTNGTRRAIEHLRTSYSDVTSDGGEKLWLHHQLPVAPVVDGATMSFEFPLQLVRERADRYGSTFSVRVTVMTSCSDQPIELLHTCGDEGIPIKLDGSDSEWSAAAVTDPGDELHPSARCVDVTSFRLEHGAEDLFACVKFAEPGFGTWDNHGDVRAYPSVTFFIDPQYPRYMDPATVVVWGDVPRRPTPGAAIDWRANKGPQLIEVAFRRAAGQNRFRVVMHADLEFVDEFDSPARLDWAAK